MGTFLRIVGFLTFFGAGILQIFAAYSAISDWLEWGTLASILGALLIGWSPLFGTVLAILGAHHAWEWSWLASSMLFVGPFFVVLALMGIAKVLDLD